jgi:hypothetical protein
LTGNRPLRSVWFWWGNHHNFSSICNANGIPFLFLNNVKKFELYKLALLRYWNNGRLINSTIIVSTWQCHKIEMNSRLESKTLFYRLFFSCTLFWSMSFFCFNFFLMLYHCHVSFFFQWQPISVCLCSAEKKMTFDNILFKFADATKHIFLCSVLTKTKIRYLLTQLHVFFSSATFV